MNTQASGWAFGLGLRWSMMDEVLTHAERLQGSVDFFEVAPENFMRRGGALVAKLEDVRQRFPLRTHGLALNIGARADADNDYVRTLTSFITRIQTPEHSDHLSWSGDAGRHWHELLPLPLSAETERRVTRRLREWVDRLARPVSLENVSAYIATSEDPLSEARFLGEVLEAANGGWLFDVNNLYVNSQNFRFDPLAWFAQAPVHRIRGIHIAGHVHAGAEGLLLDTHGAAVSDPVMSLLRSLIPLLPQVPIVLERDNHIPSLDVLVAELTAIRKMVEPSESPPLPLVKTTPRWVPDISEFDVMDLLEDDIRKPAHSPPLDCRAMKGAASRAPLSIYRRLAYDNLRSAIVLEIPAATSRLGENFDGELASFFQESGPTSPYLRDVAFEFVRWGGPRWETSLADGAFVHDLARYELAEFTVAAGPDDLAAPREPLSGDRPVRLQAAVRIEFFRYRVQDLNPAPAPSALLLYRAAAADVRVLSLSAYAAALLVLLHDGALLQDAVQRSIAAFPGAGSREHLDEVARLLADLAERGVVLGAG